MSGIWWPNGACRSILTVAWRFADYRENRDTVLDAAMHAACTTLASRRSGSSGGGSKQWKLPAIQ